MQQHNNNWQWTVTVDGPGWISTAVAERLTPTENRQKLLKKNKTWNQREEWENVMPKQRGIKAKKENVE